MNFWQEFVSFCLSMATFFSGEEVLKIVNIFTCREVNGAANEEHDMKSFDNYFVTIKH